MSDLRDYRRKRDPKKTPEPFGGDTSRKTPIFVIQRHDARRLHYDLRLERNGAGTVEIWDRGTYELLEEKRGGGLTVRLHGERAQGVWTLVPARLDGDERNWLLLRKDAPSDGAPDLRPQLAQLAERLPKGNGWLYEPK